MKEEIEDTKKEKESKSDQLVDKVMQKIFKIK